MGVKGYQRFLTELIVSIYPFASADSFLYQISLRDNLNLKETLFCFSKTFQYSHLANASVSVGGWSPIL